jgi:ketosteroid isomerase-like protein
MKAELCRMMKPAAMAVLLLAPMCVAQSGGIDSRARTEIDSGNQAWVDGVKSGNSRQIAVIYAEDAVDCGPNGECSQGRSAIDQRFRDQTRLLGPAQSAAVHSMGAVQEGEFIYEWGRADAAYAAGHRVDRYLTAWHRDTDGHWRIFRNMVIAEEQGH